MHEQSEKLCFSCEEMVIYTTFNTVNIRKMWEKKGKIRRTRPMTKKRSSEIFTLEMEIFPEIGPRKNFLVPPNSAPGLRPWSFNYTVKTKTISIALPLSPGLGLALPV